MTIPGLIEIHDHEATIRRNRDLVALYEARVDRHEEIWDESLAIIEPAVDAESYSRFLIGDFACLVAKRYGENTIGRFAKQNRKSAASVRDYRMVCATFHFSARADFLLKHQDLTYSHFKRLVRYAKAVSADAAYALLERAAVEEWSVERLTIEKDKLLNNPVAPAAERWVLGKLIDGKNQRVAFATLGTFEADDIAQFIRDHQQDPDFSTELLVTYNTKATTDGSTDLSNRLPGGTSPDREREVCHDRHDPA